MTATSLLVVKLGGRAQTAAPDAVARLWAARPREVVLVHGGGDEVSALQRALGAEPAFVGGRRVTSERDVDLVRMALSGLANKRLVAALVARGVPAVGISGEDAGLVDARLAHDGALGRVGAPHRIDASVVAHLLAGGYLPVVSPVARDGANAEGAALNVNGDDCAAALAAALGAEELLLVSDVSGVRADGVPAARLDADAARAAIASGEAAGGMAAKLEAALLALDAGVPRVRVGDLAALADASAGTCITLSPSMV